MRRNWQSAETLTFPVFVPHCPCGVADWIHVRGGENGDASSTEQVVCSECGVIRKLVRERFPIRESFFWEPE